jgi:small conductance mechanosensitive channel
MSDLIQGALIDAFEQIQQILANIIAFMPRLVGGLIILLFGLYLARRLQGWGERFVVNRRVPPSSATLVVNSLRLAGVLLAITIALYVLGADVFGLVAGLGISGLVIGFALKDIIENFLAGVLVIVREPFQPGDFIQSDQFKGHVMGIDVHATTIKTLDNTLVEIPNSLIYKECITNYSVFPVRRREINFEFAFQDDWAAVMEHLLAAMGAVEGVEAEPPPRIEMKDFRDESVAITLYYYVDTTRFDMMATHNRALIGFKQAVDQMEIALPVPTQMVVIREVDGARG